MSAVDKQSSIELGSVIMCGLSGAALIGRERELLQKLRPAGVILFAKNFDKGNPDWLSVYQKLLEDLRAAVCRDRFFVAVDHEGGRVHRFPEPVTRFPAASRWRASAADVGAAMGRELRALGCNLSFAPVLDVHNEPANPVIGERALGTDAEEVIKFAEPFRRALEAEGVIACGKHFPGHGRTTADSHHELPVLNLERSELEAAELKPFRAAVSNGIKMIMTAHVHYPLIDADKPATLSAKILTGILRDEIGFGGVVISDDLEMKALSRLPVEENSLLAMQAGVDLLLVAHNQTAAPLEDAYRVYCRLEQESAANPALSRRIEQAADRVTKLLSEDAVCSSKIKVLKESVGLAEHRALAEKLARA